ncbi:MAG: hypothetical protein AB7D57_07055 [Desulfovibrionaceae bacterium]
MSRMIRNGRPVMEDPEVRIAPDGGLYLNSAARQDFRVVGNLFADLLLSARAMMLRFRADPGPCSYAVTVRSRYNPGISCYALRGQPEAVYGWHPCESDDGGRCLLVRLPALETGHVQFASEPSLELDGDRFQLVAPLRRRHFAGVATATIRPDCIVFNRSAMAAAARFPFQDDVEVYLEDGCVVLRFIPAEGRHIHHVARPRDGRGVVYSSGVHRSGVATGRYLVESDRRGHLVIRLDKCLDHPDREEA